MLSLARFWLFAHGMIALVVTLRSLVDAQSVAAWRAEDAIWGPHALPFNAAGGLAVGFAYLFGALASDSFSPGVRGRLAAFVGLDVLVQVSTGRPTFWTTGVLALVLYGAFCEANEQRKATLPLSSDPVQDV